MMSSEQPASQSTTKPALKDLIPKPLDHKVIWIMILTALVLTGSNYLGHYFKVDSCIASLLGWSGVENPKELLDSIFKARPRGPLWRLHFWVAAHILLYFVIPVVFIKVILKEKLRDYGLKFSGWYRRLWICLGAFLVMLPLVLLVGRMESFQRAYPFYKNAAAGWPDFLGWEIPYIIQFFVLEFFFRGVLIHGLKHRFGFYAVFIMTVPYCMVHFGKPPLETIGAIIAGIFLGTLSLWTRSIWLGFLIHVSVALSMDLTALYYKDQLGSLFGL